MAFRINRWAALTVAASLFLAAGCTRQSAVKRFVGWEGPYEGGTYPPVFEKWTRESRIYRGLDLELLVHATYQSGNFQRAYVKEYARVYQFNETQTAALQTEQDARARRFHEFMIAAYVPDKKWDDFNRKESSWKIYLDLGDGTQIPAESIEKKKPDAKMKHFFPYISPWKSVYRVRFPKAPSMAEEGIIRLGITGVRGRIEMEWRSAP